MIPFGRIILGRSFFSVLKRTSMEEIWETRIDKQRKKSLETWSPAKKDYVF